VLVANNDDFSSNDDHNDEEELDDTRNLINTIRKDFGGIKVFNKVKPHIEHFYFKVTINDDTKYTHKETACWLLTDENTKLSNNRLLRVQ
jgi:hypothetical protein